VSHSEGSIVSLCSRAIWLSNGEKVIEGEPKLVTGLYMKNANKKVIEKKQIEKEMIELEKNSNKKEEKKEPQKPKASIEEFYDASFKPKSTIYYEEKGAKLSDIKVTTLEGKKVNALVQGRKYKYSYTLNIDSPIRGVQFGFLIKNINGTILGGGAYPSKSDYIEIIEKNTIVEIVFRCELNQGNYFLNCGVLADINNKKDYAHRVIDAYMIKVIEANNKITGSVNFINGITLKAVN